MNKKYFLFLTLLVFFVLIGGCFQEKSEKPKDIIIEM